MQKTKFALVLLVTALVFTGCLGEEFSRQDGTAPPAPAERPEAKQMETAADDEGAGGGGEREATDISIENQVASDPAAEETERESVPPAERKIIRNAELQLESGQPAEVQQKITAIAEKSGGFVVQTTQRGSRPGASQRDTVTMSLRVPAEKFEEVLGQIRQTADRIVAETVTGRDVTEEFIDIEARLRAKKALETQFLEIMKQARSVQDALNVQRQLAEVRGEIEEIEGRRRFLQNQASLSTINVTVRTPAAIAGSSEGFFYRLKEAVGTGIDGALSFVLGLITVVLAILPFLVLVVLPIYLILRYFWKKHFRGQKETARRGANEIVREEIGEE